MLLNLLWGSPLCLLPNWSAAYIYRLMERIIHLDISFIQTEPCLTSEWGYCCIFLIYHEFFFCILKSSLYVCGTPHLCLCPTYTGTRGAQGLTDSRVILSKKCLTVVYMSKKKLFSELHHLFDFCSVTLSDSRPVHSEAQDKWMFKWV